MCVNGWMNGMDCVCDVVLMSEVSEVVVDVFIVCVLLEGMEWIDGVMFGE